MSLNSFIIDTFLLDAGLHTIKVAVADQLGNVGSEDCDVPSAGHVGEPARTTSSGPGPRARITNTGDLQRPRLERSSTAVKSHGKGKHETEWNNLTSARNILVQDAPAKIEQATATRFIGYIDDMIAARV